MLFCIEPSLHIHCRQHRYSQRSTRKDVLIKQAYLIERETRWGELNSSSTGYSIKTESPVYSRPCWMENWDYQFGEQLYCEALNLPWVHQANQINCLERLKSVRRRILRMTSRKQQTCIVNGFSWWGRRKAPSVPTYCCFHHLICTELRVLSD